MYNGVRCSFPINKIIVTNALQEYLSDESLNEAYPLQFKSSCDFVMTILGNPVIKLENVWDIFSKVKRVFLEFGNKP